MQTLSAFVIRFVLVGLASVMAAGCAKDSTKENTSAVRPNTNSKKPSGGGNNSGGSASNTPEAIPLEKAAPLSEPLVIDPHSMSENGYTIDEDGNVKVTATTADGRVVTLFSARLTSEEDQEASPEESNVTLSQINTFEEKLRTKIAKAKEKDVFLKVSPELISSAKNQRIDLAFEVSSISSYVAPQEAEMIASHDADGLMENIEELNEEAPEYSFEMITDRKLFRCDGKARVESLTLPSVTMTGETSTIKVSMKSTQGLREFLPSNSFESDAITPMDTESHVTVRAPEDYEGVTVSMHAESLLIDVKEVFIEQGDDYLITPKERIAKTKLKVLELFSDANWSIQKIETDEGQDSHLKAQASKTIEFLPEGETESTEPLVAQIEIDLSCKPTREVRPYRPAEDAEPIYNEEDVRLGLTGP